MKIKSIFIGIALILYVGITSAIPDGGILYYDFEEGSGNLEDNWQSIIGTNTNVAFTNNVPLFNSSGDGGNYVGNFSSSDKIVVDYQVPLNFSFSAWVNVPSSGLGGIFATYQNAESQNLHIYYEGDAWQFQVVTDGGTTTCTLSGIGSNSDDGSWHHLVLLVNGTEGGCKTFFDGVEQEVVGGTGATGEDYCGASGFTMGERFIGDRDYTGSVDEWKLFDRYLTDEEVHNLYNLGTVEAADTTPPQISFSYPINGRYYFDWNRTIEFTTNENANCTTNHSLFVRFVDGGLNHTFTNGQQMSEGTYHINVSCWDANNNNDTVTLVVGIDTTEPYLNSSMKDNNLIGYNFLEFQHNFTDDRKLYSINITALDYSYYLNNINTSFYSFNGTLNLKNHSVGSHIQNVTYCDSHTAQIIKDYNYFIDYVQKRIEYKWDNNWIHISPKDPNKFSDTNTKKRVDRYNFNFTKLSQYKYEPVTYIVESNYPIDIIKDNAYTGWIVIDGLKKWIDFETPEGYKATIKRINNYKVEVTTKGWNFNSIGDLNCVTEYLNYYKYNYSIAFENKIIEGLIDVPYVLTINKTGVPIEKNNSIFIINNISYIPDKNISSNYIVFSKYISYGLINDTQDLNLSFNFTINDANFLINKTQTIYNISLYNCTTGNQSIRFNVYDEDITTTLLNSNIKYYGSFWVNDSNIATNISGYVNDSNYLAICINPYFAKIKVDLYLQYKSNGGFTHRWYLVNHTISNQTTNVSMYNFDSTTGISDVKIVARDRATYSYISNLIGMLQRLYVAEGIWRTVQMDETGDYGQLFYNIYEENTDYRFIFMERSTQRILETSESLKFVCTDTRCDLTYIIDTNGYGVSEPDSGVNVIYNNESKNITVSWNDPTGGTTNINVRITKETGSDTTLLYDSTLSGSSGQEEYEIGESLGLIYVDVTATKNGQQYYDYSNFIEVDSGQDMLSNLLTDYDGILWAFGIILTVSLFGLFSPVSGLISMMFGLVVVYFLDLTLAVTLPMVILAAILSILIGIKVKS